MKTPDPEILLGTYPRRRPLLPEAHRNIYEREYRDNRRGRNLLSGAVQRMESWMHRIIANGRGGDDALLEIGAGTLNHLPYENVGTYDVVEPFDALYEAGDDNGRLGQRYRDIAEIPAHRIYDRVVSIAVLEHLEDLPGVIARSAMHLHPGGQAQHCIPSEGALAWGVAWRLTTGLAYRLRNGLPYGVLMRYEHINRADEIIAIIRWFFGEVEIQRFPTPLHHASLYTYIAARQPRQERCRAFVEAGASCAST